MSEEVTLKTVREAGIWNAALDAAIAAIEDLPKDKLGLLATHHIQLLKVFTMEDA